MPHRFDQVGGSTIFGELTDTGQAYLDVTSDQMAAQNVGHGQIVKWEAGKFGLLGYLTDHVKALLPLDPQNLLAVGEWGQVARFAGGAKTEHEIRTEKGNAKDRGQLRRGTVIEGTPIVVGMGRQVYRWRGGAWETMEQGLPPSTAQVAGFEAVGGFSLSDIYAGGWDGELRHFNGKTWRGIDSPTSSIIVNLCCAGDGNVYCCGRTNLLLRGRDDRWEVVELEGEQDDFWGVAWFKDRLYLSSMRMVYVLDGTTLTPVDFGDVEVGTFYHLTASKDRLWSIGPKDILSFDGQAWTRVD
jgi:hypothetical protein